MAHRILRGAPATLTYQHLDADGQATDAPDHVTVGVTRADGTVVIASDTATTPAGGGRYTVALTPAQTSTLDLLTATWTVTDVPGATQTTRHELVGGYLFNIGDIAGLNGMQDYDKATLIRVRFEVEEECEWITDVAWVPRYRRLVLDGTGDDTLLTGIRLIRTVRSVRIYSTAGASTYTTFTATQLAGLVISPDGQIRRTDGDVWATGFGTTVLEVEHGHDAPLADISGAALERCQDLCLNPDSAIPPRARSYSNTNTGFSFDLTTGDKMTTGLDRVDSVYARRSYRESSSGAAGAPASRTLNYDPQFYGLFRGGRT